jgi:exopolysaccharide biosynthesis operon protein EpsL
MRTRVDVAFLPRRKQLLMGLALLAGTTAPCAFADPDAFTLKAGLTEAYDDNLFRLPGSVLSPFVTQFSGPRSDVIRSTAVGLNVVRDISRQRVVLDATVTDAKYRDHPQLDNTGRALRASWMGVYGNRWKNDLTLQNSKQLSNFSDVRSTQKNIVNTRSVADTLSYALTPEFSAVAGIGSTRTTNSGIALGISDYSTSYREAGLLFTSPSDNHVKLSYRATDGKYPNPQLIAISGTQSTLTVNNSYVQHDLGLSADWVATGTSRFDGRIGVTRRHYDDVSARDFNGSTGVLGYSWNPGGAFTMNAEVRRVIDATADVTSSYLLTNGFSLRPTWTPTAKISVSGNLDWTRRNPLGDPARSLTLLGPQEDRTRTLGLTVKYAPVRRIDLALNLRDERRVADLAGYGYRDQFVSLVANLHY